MTHASARHDLKLSPAQEDYIKALYQLRREGRSVGTSELSDRLGVAPASAAQMLVRLAAVGLVAHDRYRGAVLTPAGEAVALEMIRHHRLLEMYLAQALGYAWDEVHDEAERLEHFISEQMEDRIYAALGQPAVDPHGDPIPSRGGHLAASRYVPLDECPAGRRLVVRRVSDRDPELLRELARIGLRLGAEVEVVSPSRYEGPIGVRVGGRRRAVALGLARAVFLEEVSD
jgi:DtxR family transcriptional regulator, Mn-dependent transcriptional regulator